MRFLRESCGPPSFGLAKEPAGAFHQALLVGPEISACVGVSHEVVKRVEQSRPDAEKAAVGEVLGMRVDVIIVHVTLYESGEVAAIAILK